MTAERDLAIARAVRDHFADQVIQGHGIGWGSITDGELRHVIAQVDASLGGLGVAVPEVAPQGPVAAEPPSEIPAAWWKEHETVKACTHGIPYCVDCSNEAIETAEHGEQHTHLGWLAKVSQAEHNGRRAEQQHAAGILGKVLERWGMIGEWNGADQNVKDEATAYISEAEAAHE
jgi:hypothetical protein